MMIWRCLSRACLWAWISIGGRLWFANRICWFIPPRCLCRRFASISLRCVGGGQKRHVAVVYAAGMFTGPPLQLLDFEARSGRPIQACGGGRLGVRGVAGLYGVSVNNNPSVQDVWNTTPAWGIPYIASTIAPQFAPPGTTIEGALGGRVVGILCPFTGWARGIVRRLGRGGVSCSRISPITLNRPLEPTVISARSGLLNYYKGIPATN